MMGSLTLFATSAAALIVSVGKSLLFALIVFFIGRAVINKIVKLLSGSRLLGGVEGTVKSFALSFVRIGLMVLLVIAVIGILGVPLASVITVLASAGVAVGLALQGALSNLAGGIMLMIFKPFKTGDFVEAAGVAGVCSEVTLFYSVFITPDNRRITVPNGSLMNANIADYSSEPTRRVDLTFSVAKSENPVRVREMMIAVMKENSKVLSDPAPFARVSGGSNEGTEITVRAWCASENYWDVYFDLNDKITETLGANGVQAPAVRVIQ